MKHSKLLLLPLLAISLASCGPKEVDKDAFLEQVATNSSRENKPTYTGATAKVKTKQLEKSGDTELFDDLDIEDDILKSGDTSISAADLEVLRFDVEAARAISVVNPLVTTDSVKYYIYSDGGVAYETVYSVNILVMEMKTDGTFEYDNYNYSKAAQAIITFTVKAGDKAAKLVYEGKTTYELLK